MLSVLTILLEMRGDMVQFISILDGLTRSVSIKKTKSCRNGVGREAAKALAKEAKKNDLILKSSGIVNSGKSGNLASAYSMRGRKGINQDSFVVWEEFGCQADVILCGVFDGHGPWGHIVSKRVRKSILSSLLCAWQESLARKSLVVDLDDELRKKLHPFSTWKESYLIAYDAIDQELKQHPGIDSFCSGCTALSMIRQGDDIVIANVGDSRAVLASASDDGSLVAVQLTIDSKPNMPEEAERISQSKGRVFSLQDEPGVYRIWMPSSNSSGPGLAVSRALGDDCMKEYGLISVPEVTHKRITSRDRFVILATDGVWDVISNEEAVRIVSKTRDREKSAKRLAECAAQAWKRKRCNIAMDDISIICLFFHS